MAFCFDTLGSNSQSHVDRAQPPGTRRSKYNPDPRPGWSTGKCPCRQNGS